eukprot:jgi/Mesvir1/8684/Mv02622-RA.1
MDAGSIFGPDACTTVSLRSVNLLASLACLALFYTLRRVLHRDHGEVPAGATAVTAVLGLYPLHFFFGFVYYTDVLALATLLATHACVLHRRYYLGAMFGAASILMRQTNVVWMAFSFAVGLHRFGCDAARREAGAGKGYGTGTGTGKGKGEWEGVGLFDLLRCLWARKVRVCVLFGPALAVGAVFVAFVVFNGGIVMGDKQAHQASLHVSQVLYFLAYATAMSFPSHLSRRHLDHVLAPVLARPLRSVTFAAMALVLILAVVHRYTLEHPYLLADNRHLTFYLWKGIMRQHPHVRYWLSPAYLVCGWSFLTLLSVKLGQGSLSKTLVPLSLTKVKFLRLGNIVMLQMGKAAQHSWEAKKEASDRFHLAALLSHLGW